MNKEKFNPFNSQDEDLEIKSREELDEAKEIAGVVSRQEHLERMLTSGDKKLIQVGLEQLNKKLEEKDNEIDMLKEQVRALEKDKIQLNKIREVLGLDKDQENVLLRTADGEVLWDKESEGKTKDMGKEEFEGIYGSGLESFGRDPRIDYKDETYRLGPVTGAVEYYRGIREALNNKSKEVIVVEGEVYIVDKK
jgi:hypothetical protein